MFQQIKYEVDINPIRISFLINVCIIITPYDKYIRVLLKLINGITIIIMIKSHMKILLAPAETKREGGNSSYSSSNFYFQEYNNIRNEVVSSYEDFLRKSTIEKLSSWFGLKNLKECEKYSTTVTEKPTMKAIRRYTGVAF